MKYFKYYIWYKGKHKTSFQLKRYGGSYNNIDMPFFGEIDNGKNYDLITGEEIAYCPHPYLGSLSFCNYELTTAYDVEFFLKLMKPEDIRDYKKFITMAKQDSLKQSPELAQSRYIRGGKLPEYPEVKALVKKMRK